MLWHHQCTSVHNCLRRWINNFITQLKFIAQVYLSASNKWQTEGNHLRLFLMGGEDETLAQSSNYLPSWESTEYNDEFWLMIFSEWGKWAACAAFEKMLILSWGGKGWVSLGVLGDSAGVPLQGLWATSSAPRSQLPRGHTKMSKKPGESKIRDKNSLLGKKGNQNKTAQPQTRILGWAEILWHRL